MQQPHSKDVEDNKIWAVLAYFLFFIPLVTARESKFAMYHANQGLILLIFAVAINVIGAVIPVLGWLLIIPFGNLAIMVYLIIGIIQSASGKIKPLPLIGNFEIIK
ncbi:DUF4870 domain-containing protein [Chengkuizengella axinellae]|uniref:DUF4870 domain-containing protein n=1 Tax=Chengkuizengella axinellae TaxID=3064388 RepID=A0ABT9J0A7_9BACL|nr:hypothetical protein [Chengkuizengella sp. 2205SS18-9]MDP5275059.1 hypothetical protein [Chengkuizengella sp. 2205SS18-9]